LEKASEHEQSKRQFEFGGPVIGQQQVPSFIVLKMIELLCIFTQAKK